MSPDLDGQRDRASSSGGTFADSFVCSFVRTGSGFLGRSAGRKAATAETEGSETATERAKSLKCLITAAGGNGGRRDDRLLNVNGNIRQQG